MGTRYEIETGDGSSIRVDVEQDDAVSVQSIMLSSKLLPEMEVEETLNRERLFFTQQERVTIVCHN